MDQNSSSGSGADKRNWRERLGIGGKDMPKISDEFKAAAPAPALKVPQPVAKPAPMAPRATPGKYAAAPSSEALAEKLRSQRVAAEKLAEQRVSVARERAEAKVAPEAAAPVLEPSLQARPEARAEPTRPKFSFADEEPVKAESMPQHEPPPRSRTISAPPIPPPLVPPRPALGGDRLPPPARLPTSRPATIPAAGAERLSTGRSGRRAIAAAVQGRGIAAALVFAGRRSFRLWRPAIWRRTPRSGNLPARRGGGGRPCR